MSLPPVLLVGVQVGKPSMGHFGMGIKLESHMPFDSAIPLLGVYPAGFLRGTDIDMRFHVRYSDVIKHDSIHHNSKRLKM